MRVLSVVGNRPQFIKSAPLSAALREAGIDEVVLHTGQHYDPRAVAGVLRRARRSASRATGSTCATSDPARCGRRSARRSRASGPTGCSSTATRTRRSPAREAAGDVPVAHVEAGLRSFDLSMPEERNRIAVDRIAALLLCPDERSARQLEREGVAGRSRGRRRRDGRRDAALRAARARALGRARAARPRARAATPSSTRPPRGERDRPTSGCARIVDGPRPRRGAARLPGAPAHARGARRGSGSTLPTIAAARLPRLRRARLAGARDRHRLGRAAEGGVLVRRPVRDAAAVDRVGRHGRGRRERARRRRPRRDRARRSPTRASPPTRRRSTATATPSERVAAALYASGRDRREPDLGRRHRSAPATSACRSRRPSPTPGSRVLLVDAVPELVDGAEPRREPHRGRPLGRRSRRTSRPGRIARDARLRRSSQQAARDPDRAADAAHEAARARPLATSRAPRARLARGAPARARSSCSSRRRTPARRARSCKPMLEEGSGLEAGEDFHLAMSPERVDPGRTDWTTKTTPKIVGGLTPACDRGAPPTSTAARDRHRAHRLDARGGRADEAAREHLPLGQHRARQRARAALRPDGHRRLGGRRRGGDEAVRLHVVPARPRPRRPLHPARPVLPLVEGARVRLLDALHRARRRGQQQHAVLLPLGDLAGAEPRRCSGRCRARGSCCSASPTRPTSATCARRRPRS